MSVQTSYFVQKRAFQNFYPSNIHIESKQVSEKVVYHTTYTSDRESKI